VTLSVTTTHTDGAFFVYLEAVDASGEVTYITEGQLRGIHRRLSNEAMSYTAYGPVHSFRRRDALPLVPGERITLEFELFPTSVLFKQGVRIQIGLAGHDADTFQRVPAGGDPVISVHYPGSCIDLPVVER
jgi:predicted acyl esterase